MLNLIDQTQSEVMELAGRVYAAAGRLTDQQLDDLKHTADTLKGESPSPCRRLAAYVVADCCGEVQKERRLRKANT